MIYFDDFINQIKFAPKYVKDCIDALQKYPEQSNRDYALNTIKGYLEHNKDAYIEYKNKMSDFPELKDFVDEYKAIKNFYNQVTRIIIFKGGEK